MSDRMKLYDLDVLLAGPPCFIPRKLLRGKVRSFASYACGVFLDIGCRDRPYRFFFSKVAPHLGTDLEARRRPHVVGSAERLPFHDRLLDTVLCTGILQLCPNSGKVLCKIKRVLHPVGTLSLPTPMCWNLHYEPDDDFPFTRYGVTLLLERAGLQTLHAGRLGGVFALCGARLTEVICKTTARALKSVSRPLRQLVVGVHLLLMMSFFTASRLLEWVVRTDAIGWIVLAQRPVEEAL